MALVLILQITLSKFCSPVSCKGGAHSEYSRFSFFIFIYNYYPSRCTVKQTNLDGEGGRCSHEHTELLVREFELGTLWDEYGLVGDLVVCFHAFSFFFTKIPILIAIYK
jgi:hypothetical protein